MEYQGNHISDTSLQEAKAIYIQYNLPVEAWYKIALAIEKAFHDGVACETAYSK